MLDIYCYYIQMPYGVKGSVVENIDGSYTVYINSLYNHEQCINTLKHEIEEHIKNDDLNCFLDAQQIELRSHNI